MDEGRVFMRITLAGGDCDQVKIVATRRMGVGLGGQKKAAPAEIN